MLESGTVAVKCNVSESAIQDINFPKNSSETGSQVIFVTERHNQVPYVIGVLDRIMERAPLFENSFTFHRELGNSRVIVIGKGTGELSISVESNSGADLNIDVLGAGSKTKLKCEGEIDVIANSTLSISSSSNVSISHLKKGKKDASLTISEDGLKYTDEDDNIFEVDRKANKINCFKGGSPVPLGDELKQELDQTNEYLEKLQSAISTAFVALDALGVPVSTTFNLSMLSTRKGNFQKINSTKTFTD